MKVSTTEPVLSEQGQDALSDQAVSQSAFEKKSDEIGNSQDIQDEIKTLSNDEDGLTQEDLNKVGEEVADKALKELGGEGIEGLNQDQKMALAEYCMKCFDKQANEAADEAMTQPAAT